MFAFLNQAMPFASGPDYFKAEDWKIPVSEKPVSAGGWIWTPWDFGKPVVTGDDSVMADITGMGKGWLVRIAVIIIGLLLVGFALWSLAREAPIQISGGAA